MSAPSLPTGYDVSKLVTARRSDCAITVGFDRRQGDIPRFLVQLHYQVATGPVTWQSIARMDHNKTAPDGHDVYLEGVHVDVHRRSGSTVHLGLRHAPLPTNPGTVVRGCVGYLDAEAEYFVDVFEGRHSPGSPPRWTPDGGSRERSFNHMPAVDRGMSQNADAEPVSHEELSELLADATGTSAETIEREAREMEIAPPEEADVVDVSE